MTAAFLLSQNGYRVTVYEAAPSVGGRLRAYGIDPVFDTGSHLMLRGYRSTRQLIKMLGVKERFFLPGPVTLEFRFPERTAYLRYGRLPGSARYAAAFLNSDLFPRLERLRLLARLRRLKSFSPRDTNAADASRMMEQLLAVGPSQREFWRLLAVSIFNTPLEQVDSTLFIAVLQRLFLQGEGADPMFPRTSVGVDLVEPLLQQLQQGDCEIQLRTPVQKLVWREDNLQELVTSAGRVHHDYYILAMPPDRWCRLMKCDTPVRNGTIATIYFRTSQQLSTSPLLGFPGAPVHWVIQRSFREDAPCRYAAVISNYHGDRLQLEQLWNDLQQRHFPGSDLFCERKIIYRKAVPLQDAVFQAWRQQIKTSGPNWHTIGDWTCPLLPATIEAAIESAMGLVEVKFSGCTQDG
ncbi:MAG: FAD-dependent oxidoreductase [Pirellulales bacterium]|nr:FAD-dependent oxidoreductase [Pirellulales bacterium]